ncbi:MAG: hypothetical protein ACJA2Y_000996 [Cycloclasticus pugetii]|jgi:hypothetical protein|uniref:DEAD/DEAH box helicase family protein n=1 Tax=Cycloclasticus pugetii TaxID=34068 RepID=UPI0039E2D67C
MAKRRTRRRNNTLPFSAQLIVAQWLFAKVGFESTNGRFLMDNRDVPLIEALRDRYQLKGDTTLRNSEGEHAIVSRLLAEADGLPGISDDELREYDRNIKHLTEKLNDGRAIAGEQAIEWKYFQYLMLLFTEVYLDWLFQKPEALRDELNSHIETWNLAHEDETPLTLLDTKDMPWLELNKVAYWSATGSGKTLIMHANILQYQYYLERYGNKKDLGRIILLTPNEGLTRQHIQELAIAGIEAAPFTKNQGSLFDKAVIVIDINKFRDEGKDKTVSTASFGNNNLVLVDEGHRGTSSGGDGTFLRHRNALCEKGFSFEYSATFAQAAMKSDAIRQQYSKAILFDYSYRHFYADGYGKQSQILNLQSSLDDSEQYKYLVASLLSFYQQRRVFDDKQALWKTFNIEPPLWIFVSSRVTAKGIKGEESDSIQVLKFIDNVLNKREATITAIRRLLEEGLVASGGTNLLHGRFDYLKGLTETADAIYDDMLDRVFHTTGGRLYIENISGAAGEIALRGGVADTPFGVINVGDDTKLVKLCEQHGLEVQEARFSGSLFSDINKPNSKVNLLVGSRKFTEGWSSWRVSNMTLMNIGSSEGAQIIQLFGRGVRLKGWNETLKRSAEVVMQLPEGIERPKEISVLETLNIFGVKADYIAQFRKELEAEEILVNEGLQEYRLPLKPMSPMPGTIGLIRLQEMVEGRSIGKQGSAFSNLAEQVFLLSPNKLTGSERAYFIDLVKVTLDWYPKLKGFAADGLGQIQVNRNTDKLSKLHLAMLDTDRLYFELLQFKRDKRWASLTLSRDEIPQILANTNWYTLHVPKEALSIHALNGVKVWHDIAISLLKKYCEVFYGLRRRQWEADKLEYRPLKDDKRILPCVSKETPDGSYIVTVDLGRHEALIKQLDNLQEKVKNNKASEWAGTATNGLEFVWCERHLYQPLIAQHDKEIEVSPVPLNKGEQQFVSDIQKAIENDVMASYDTYLLRNESKGDGVGFFVDGGFYPDFILWLVKEDQQKIIFIDPKGLRNLGINDPKIRFYKTIKDIESDLHDKNPAYKNIEMHAFLVSNTNSSVLESLWSIDDFKISKEEMDARNILFPVEDSESYIKKLIDKVEL